MKATGIVRRIDDLGRVVIPKEIRRTMRIREGDPLEIYTDREGEVIFKKYSPIGELVSFAAQYADTLNKTCGMSVIITDRDVIIACAGVSKKEYTEKKVSEEIEDIIESRTLYMQSGDATKIPVIDDGGSHYVSCAMPIIRNRRARATSVPLRCVSACIVPMAAVVSSTDTFMLAASGAISVMPSAIAERLVA